MYQVQKRDGKVIDFSLDKITKAITMAFEAQEKDYHPAVRFGDSPVHGSDPVVECDQVEVVEGILHLVDC